MNNYQDHVECKEKKDERITLNLPKGDITISGISMAAGEEAILPFGMDLGGVRLVYAKAQPLSVVREEGKTVYFFFTPEGMEAEYCFDQETVTSLDGAVEKEIYRNTPQNVRTDIGQRIPGLWSDLRQEKRFPSWYMAARETSKSLR